jgi:hypothetical protein
MNTINVKQTAGSNNKEFEIPTDLNKKERLMKYHGVNNDRDLRLALYRDWLRKKRNERS